MAEGKLVEMIPDPKVITETSESGQEDVDLVKLFTILNKDKAINHITAE